MNEAQQLKLQAFLDGELPAAEAREILAWTQRDADAAALLAELKNTRQALAKSESHPALPESREFFWSKIHREIERLEPRAKPSVSIFAALRRLLLPTAALATLVIAGLLVYFHAPVSAEKSRADADATSVETTMANTEATTYRDASEDTTLVWFSYSPDQNPVKNIN